MADQVSAKRRQHKLASYHRRVAERIAQGMCPKCGKRPPAPDRRQCEPCAEKAREADRARAERLRAEGKPVRDPEARRQADRERDRRQHAERKAAGLCVKCGRAPALPERTQCGPCAERRLATDRERHARARAEGKPRRDSAVARLADRERGRRRRAERRAAGLCIRCGNVAPEEGRSMCEPCRDDRRAAKRARRAERRAAGRCEDCAAPVTGGAAYCAPCAAARNERRQRDPEAHRKADRRRYAERRARGDCTSCGKPAQGAAECEACRDAARARYHVRRAAARARYDARRAAGVCVRCQTPTVGDAAYCANCAVANVGQRDREAENAARRRQYAERRDKGLCVGCGAPSPSTARCAPCAAVNVAQRDRDAENAAKRQRYAERRAEGRCVDCNAPSPWTARCEPCSLRQRETSGAFRGIPLWDPSWTVIEIATGEDLGTYDSEMEVAACLAFAKLSREEVEVIPDASLMASFTAPPWW